MCFNCTYSVTIPIEELEKLLPENAKKLITDECRVDSICDMFLVVDNANKTLSFLSKV